MAIKKPTLPFITGGNTDVNNPDGGNLSNKTKYVFTFLPEIPLLEIYLEDISSNIYIYIYKNRYAHVYSWQHKLQDSFS